MLVECYDKKGAEVYEIIIKQIFQDLVLGSSVDDLKAFVNPDDPVFILAIKMKKTSNVIKFGDVADFTYNKEKDVTTILIGDENYLPNILNKLWRMFSRDEIYQPNRYVLEISGNQSNSAENVTSDHTGACLDGWLVGEISTLISHFFMFNIGQDISLVLCCNVWIVTFG